MLSNAYRCTNTYTGEYIDINAPITDFTQGVVLSQYPVWQLDVRNTEINKTGQHGIWDFFSFYGKRTIIFQGTIFQPSFTQLIAVEEKLRRVFNLPSQPAAGNDGYVQITWTDVNNRSWLINAKISDDITFKRTVGNRVVAEFHVGLKCDNPYIISQTQNQVTGLLGWVQGALYVPQTLPAAFYLYYDNAIDIYSSGTTDAPAIYRLWGATTNPTIKRLDITVSEQTTISNFLPTDGWSGGTNNTTIIQGNNTNSRKLTSVSGSTDSMSLTQSLDLNYDNDYETETILTSFEEGSNLFYRDSTKNLAIDYALKTEGNASLSFDYDPAISPANKDTFVGQTISTPIDLTGYQDGYVTADVYVPAGATNINSISLMLFSNQGSNIGIIGSSTTDINGNAFANGWNTVKVLIANMTQIGTSLFDISQTNSPAVKISFSNAQTAQAGYHVDNFVAHKPTYRDWIDAFIYIDNVNNIGVGDYLTAPNYIKFAQNVGVDEFVMQFSEANLTLRNGWNYLRMLKSQFTRIGSPNWSLISKVTCSITSRTGTTLNVYFEQLTVQNNSTTEQFIRLNTTIASGEFVDINILNGTVLLNGSTDVSGNLDTSSGWFGVLPKQNVFVYTSDDPTPLTTFTQNSQRVDIFWNDAMI